MRNDGAESENDPPESENPEVQYVWSRRYIDAPVLRDRDADSDSETGDLGVTDSGLEERLYYTTDANMNVTALLDTAGDAVERYLYDPYGNVTVLDADFSADADGKSDYANAILYCGYRFDTETGLYHVRWRVYHPTLGRWLQRDPAGYEDGTHLYAYVYNAPISLLDPSGLAVTIRGERVPASADQHFDGWQATDKFIQLNGEPGGNYSFDVSYEVTIPHKTPLGGGVTMSWTVSMDWACSDAYEVYVISGPDVSDYDRHGAPGDKFALPGIGWEAWVEMTDSQHKSHACTPSVNKGTWEEYQITTEWKEAYQLAVGIGPLSWGVVNVHEEKMAGRTFVLILNCCCLKFSEDYSSEFILDAEQGPFTSQYNMIPSYQQGGF